MWFTVAENQSSPRAVRTKNIYIERENEKNKRIVIVKNNDRVHYTCASRCDYFTRVITSYIIRNFHKRVTTSGRGRFAFFDEIFGCSQVAAKPRENRQTDRSQCPRKGIWFFKTTK